ncbi:aspartate kinase [Alkalicoccus luteus]|uniref:Aspartokinase n=1 Tax=Alkalicoccus luteus TaxID=1237094 RepID=A0A969PQ05_9BACI|nr:aspartate kinase [Alkalicoccus luteus]NJP36301.1 aspartate kinase [Alkalicoccus luteus]
MKLIVQKFGGSSLQTEAKREQCAAHISDALQNGYKVVAVVSAIGRSGDPYATDTLLTLAGGATPVVSAKELDMLMACGETISSVAFSALLQRKGIKAGAMNGAEAGFRTNEVYGDARITEMQTAALETALEEMDVIVVTGFQGQTPKGTTATLGRGGSDTSATALGAALKADLVDIFTDVAGIMTADPRIAGRAMPLKAVTYAEVSNMAYQGAKVIHPRAVEIAMQAEIPLRIRAFSEDGPGTMIRSSVDGAAGQDLKERPVTAVTHKDHVCQIKASGPEPKGDVFTAMAEAGISVDFISIHPDFATFTIPSGKLTEALDSLQDLPHDVTWTDDCAKVAVVGGGMSGVPGIAAKIVSALEQREIRVLQSADSHTTIWVLVSSPQMPEAVNILHDSFLIGE